MVATLGDREWIELLSRDHPPSGESVIYTSKFRKTLRIGKEQWQRVFAGYGGIDLEPGKEIALIAQPQGGAKVTFPNWAVEQLTLGAGDMVCITKREERFYVKKLELVERPAQIPGCIVIDVFEDDVVKRTYSNRPDLESIHLSELRQLLFQMGQFRYDPLTPFQQMDGWLGLLARKTFLGGWSQADRDALQAFRRQVIDGQGEGGSWERDVLKTASNLIRLLEMEATPQDPTVESASRWLLSLPEPIGLPGLFLLSEKLTQRFNQWKQKAGAKGRPHRRESKRERRNFLDNVDRIVNCATDACDLRLMWTSALVLEALLRCGLHDEPRVVRAINTLLELSGTGNWCGCGYLDARVGISESNAAVDLNRSPVPQENQRHSIDWFSDRNDILDLACNGEYRAFEAADGQGLLVKFFHNTGLCRMVVNRALSYHPSYPGSNLEAIAALFHSFCQSAYGTWGNEVYLSSMFGFMARSTHPLDAFLVLRSVPLLIREQRSDGFWQEEPIDYRDIGCPPPTKEESTFLILEALMRFDFLDILLPTQ